jgi:MscS family membrane protein
MSFLGNIYYGNTVAQYLFFFGSIIVAVIIGKIIAWISKGIVRTATKKTKTKLDDIIIDSLEKPLVFLLFTAGFYFGRLYLTLSERMAEIFSNAIEILLIINVTWFITSIVDALIKNYAKPLAEKTKSELDDQLLPILRKLVKIVIVIIAAIMIISKFGYDISSLLAGLGLGGLAFALAAQDMLSNIFGGIAIFTDKPFKIGDRIKLDEKNDGWVREITLRSTRLETLDGTMVVIPNSKIANSILENISKEQARKIKMTIGVEYDTSNQKMEEAKKIIEDAIRENKDTKNESLVSFFNFGDSALEFLVIYWIKNIDNLLGAKHKINMEIKKRFEKAKISMAFPTRTIHIKK